MADNTIATAYVQLTASTEGIKGDVEKAMGAAGESGAQSFGNSFSGFVSSAGRVAGAIASAAAVGISALTTQSVQSYSEYEQLIGGVETLFGAGGKGLQAYAASIGQSMTEALPEFNALIEAQNAVQANAAVAWKTAGLSMNDYMTSITAFAASLKQSTETELEAAQVADMAIIDMSDNANKMGSSMESIQNAYQGFAKQNYTMLDNLKLGYGGTKGEMERLLEDATAISGIEYNIENLSDVFNAIHVIQVELGITGTTSEEAASTITGSLSSVTAAWQNVLTGVADDTADFDGQINDLVDSIGAFASNMLPRIETAIVGIGNLFTKLAPKVIEVLPGLLEALLPNMVVAITTLLSSLAAVMPDLLGVIFDNIPMILKNIMSILPDLLGVVMQVITSLIQSVGEALPEVLPVIVDTIMQLLTVLFSNFSLIMDAALVLVQGLAEGILNAIPVLMEKMPELIKAIVGFLENSASTFIEVVVTIIQFIAEAFPEIVNEFMKVLPDIITGIITALMECGPELGVAFVELFAVLITVMPEIIGGILEAMPEVITAIIDGIKNGWPEIETAAKDSFNKLKDAFVNSKNLENIKEKCLEIFNKIKDTFSSKFEEFKGIGGNIINGLIEGLKSGIGKIGDTITGIGEDIVNGFTGFFNIHSPSRLMRDDVGYNIGAGVAEGIEESGNVIDEAVAGLNTNIEAEVAASASVTGSSIFSSNIQSENKTNDSVYYLLAEYLPLLANKETSVTLQGDAEGLFNIVVKRNNQFKKANGRSAFA